MSELSTTYIKDVLPLCGLVEPNRTEADKVEHLLKGIWDNLFRVIAPENPTTVRNFIAHGRQFKELLNRRSLGSSLQGLPMDSPGAPIDEYMARFIREVVRKEVRAFYGVLLTTLVPPDGDVGQPPATYAPSLLTLKDPVQDELRALHHHAQNAPIPSLRPIQHDLGEHHPV